MRVPRAALIGVGLLALSIAAAGNDDTRKPQPADDPDPSFLEFLGSVDRLAEVSPDYLAQATRPAQPAVKPPAAPPPPAPPPSGGKNND